MSISEPMIHSVQIKEDGTFVHKYSDIEGTLSNSGTWNLAKEKCKLYFSNWQSFGKYREEDCLSGCAVSINLIENELQFNLDLKEMNFRKEDN